MLTYEVLNDSHTQLQFDIKESSLYIDNVEDLIGYTKSFENNSIDIPVLQYDKTRNILYTNTFNNIDSFDDD
jgi:hypothetical protein